MGKNVNLTTFILVSVLSIQDYIKGNFWTAGFGTFVAVLGLSCYLLERLEDK